MQVVLPELDGRLLTTAIAFKQETDGRTLHAPDAQGVALAADRAAGWARLAALPRGERRVAIVLSDYPGLGGQRGHAVGLDSFASLAVIIRLLHEAGYGATPAQASQLAHELCRGEPAPFLSLAEYQRLFAGLPETLRQAASAAWGPPADDPAFSQGAFTLRHVRLERILALIQPDRGQLRGPARLLSRPGFAAPAQLHRALSLAARQCGRAGASRHPWVAGVVAGKGRRTVRRLLAACPDPGAPGDLPLHRQQPRRGRRSQAAAGCGHDRPPDTAPAPRAAAWRGGRPRAHD